MNIRTFVLALVATLAAASHAADPQAGSTAPALEPAPAVTARLQAFRSDYVASLREGDPQKIAGYYAETIRLMPEYQKTVLGRAHALAYHRALATRFAVQECRRKEVEILDLGSYVLEIGEFALKLAPRAEGPALELAGKYLDLWAKAEDGALSLVTAAWNHRHRIDEPDALRFAEVPAVQMAFQARLPVKDRVGFELAALNKLLEATVSQHDGDVWAQFYADDAMILSSYVPLNRGRKAVDDYIKSHARQLPVFEKLDIRNDRVDVSGYFIIEYATHVANWRDGDSSGVNTGKNLRIWRREPDGRLKLFRHIGMYD